MFFLKQEIFPWREVRSLRVLGRRMTRGMHVVDVFLCWLAAGEALVTGGRSVAVRERCVVQGVRALVSREASAFDGDQLLTSIVECEADEECVAELSSEDYLESLREKEALLSSTAVDVDEDDACPECPPPDSGSVLRVFAFFRPSLMP